MITVEEIHNRVAEFYKINGYVIVNSFTNFKIGDLIYNVHYANILLDNRPTNMIHKVINTATIEEAYKAIKFLGLSNKQFNKDIKHYKCIIMD